MIFKKKILIIADKVMPYRSAFYRKLSESLYFDVKVFFIDKWGAEKRFDPTMASEYKWDGPIFGGFKFKFLKSKSLFNVTYTGVDKLSYENKLPLIGSLLFYIRTFCGLISLELLNKNNYRDTEIIIIEGCHSFSLLIPAIMGKILGKKVFLRKESYINKEKSLIFRIIKFIFFRIILTLYDKVLYSCTTNKELFLYYKVNSHKLVFVPTAVDNEFFLEQKRLLQHTNSMSIRDELEFNENTIVILGVGRFVPRKNWNELIEAFQLVNNKYDVALILLGDGPEKDLLMNFVKGNDIQNIYFIGFKNQTEISKYYYSSDIIILTSNYDPSPKVLNEALVFSLPIIVSNKIGTAYDLCKDGVNGYIYNYGHTNELAKKIEYLIINKDAREIFGNNSFKLAQRWSLNTGVKNIESIFIKEKI